MSYPDLPTKYAPREGTAPIGPLFQLELDGVPTTTGLQLGIGLTRPVTSFTAYPGPAKPTIPGTYLVVVTDGTNYDAIAWLVIY